MKKEDEFAQKLLCQIQEMFDENCENHISREDLEEHATEFTHALANIVPAIVYSKITGENANSLQFNHIANILCFKFAKKED